MKHFITMMTTIVVLSGFFCFKLITNHNTIDEYNEASGSFRWVTQLGDDIRYVRKMGDDRQYFIAISSNEKEGVIDGSGKEILPCDYWAVDYLGGNHMAAATNIHWMLMDLAGNEVASFNRIPFPYAYAGD